MIRLVSAKVLNVPSGKPLSDSRQSNMKNNKVGDVSQSSSSRQSVSLFLPKTCQILKKGLKCSITQSDEQME